MDTKDNTTTTPEDQLKKIQSALENSSSKLWVEKIDDVSFKKICRIKSLKELHINDLNIRELSGEILNCVELESLTILKSTLKTISPEIFSLKNLKDIELFKTSLEKIPEEIGNLKSLTRLQLSYNMNITGLPETIGNLSNLKEFTIRNCRIKKIPESIGNLKNLEYLYIQSNQITELPGTIHKLKNIRSYEDSGNLFTYPKTLKQNYSALFEYFRKDSKVKHEYYEFYAEDSYKFWEIALLDKEIFLNSGGNGRNTSKALNYDTEDEAIKDYEKRTRKKIKEGYISGNREFPLHIKKKIEEAKESSALAFEEYYANDEIFNEICKIDTLKKLRLYSTGFISIPDEIKNLQKLEELLIHCRCELETIPSCIKDLQNLTSLEIKNANFSEIPQELAALKNLKKLQLIKCRIKKMPEDTGNLKGLVLLGLKSNMISELPENLEQFKNLEDLDLSENRLTALPENIDELENLEDFDLSENLLEELPESIGNLENLEELDLSENKLSKLPVTIGNLEDIDLDIDRNKFVLPEGIRSTEEIIEYFTSGTAPEKITQKNFEIDEADKNVTEEEKTSILKKYDDKIKQFIRDIKYCNEEKRDRILKFIKCESDTLPVAEKNDYLDFKEIIELLSPVNSWTFVDRRIMAYITQADWCWKKGKYYHGFYEEFYSWVKVQVKKEAGQDVFSVIVKELNKNGQNDEKEIVNHCVTKLHSVILTDNNESTSVGRYLLSQYDNHLDYMLSVAKGMIYEFPLIGLFAKYRAKDFESRLEKILFSNDCAPYKSLQHLLEIDSAQYEPYVNRAMDMTTSCQSCIMRTAALTLVYYNNKYYSRVLSETRKTIQYICEKKKEDPRYNFPWQIRFEDGTAQFLNWALDNFKEELYEDILNFVEDTKYINLDVLSVVAGNMGQKGIAIICEGLNMKDTGDSLEKHFERLFSILNPFDYSAYIEKIWEVAQYKSIQVNRLAAGALAKLGKASVINKAKELLKSSKKKERLAAVLVLSHFNDDKEIIELFTDMKNSETDPTIREEITAVAELTYEDIMISIENMRGSGKLNKPVSKWLDEDKLPELKWKMNGETVAPHVIRYIFFIQKKKNEMKIDKEAGIILDKIDRNSTSEFADSLLKLIMKNGGFYVKNRFALTVAGFLGDVKTVKALKTSVIKDKNLNALNAIAIQASDEALLALDEIRRHYKTKYPNIRNEATEAFSQIADSRGVNVGVLLDLIVPDFGFVGRTREFTFGDSIHKSFIDADLSLKFINDKGKTVKSVPASASDEDKKLIKTLKADIKEAAKQQKENVETGLVIQRKWDRKSWENLFLNNPLMFALGRAVVWGIYFDGNLVETFHVTDEITFRNFDNKAIQLQDKNWESDFWNLMGMKEPKPYNLRKKDFSPEIGIVHPIELTKEIIDKWKEKFESLKIKQSIKQLERKVYALDEENKNKKINWMFENNAIRSFAFDRLGWRRGSVVDGGGVSSYKKEFPHENIDAFIELDNVAVQFYDFTGSLKQFYFVPKGSIYTGSYYYDEPRNETDSRLIPLDEVPPIIYSEVVSDLYVITKDGKE